MVIVITGSDGDKKGWRTSERLGMVAALQGVRVREEGWAGSAERVESLPWANLNSQSINRTPTCGSNTVTDEIVFR